MYDPNVRPVFSCVSLLVFLTPVLLQELVGRCFIEAWAVTDELLTEFRMPFVRGTGEYDIKFLNYAYQIGGKAEIFMVIEQVRRGHLQNRLELCGARQVVIHSFPSNDPNQLAGKFLNRVIEKSDIPGVSSYQRGSCNISLVSDSNQDDNAAIYEELKALQLMQHSAVVEEDAVH